MTRLISRSWTAVLVTAWLALPIASRAGQRTASAEDNVKAAFLFNFTKFIHWPAPTHSDHFRICTVAEPEFNAAVERTLAGEAVGGRPILRVTPPTPEAARACQILFLGRPEHDRVGRWLDAVRGTPVLVVGESGATWDRGAHINFVLDDNRVKFDVNEGAAADAGLVISSKLLRVARKVARRSSP